MKGSLTSLAYMMTRTHYSGFFRLFCIAMCASFDVYVQGMDVFKRDVTVATSVLGSVEPRIAMVLPSGLAFEGMVAFRTKAMTRSSAMVFKDIQALAGLSAIATSTTGEIVLIHSRMFATFPADM